MYQCAHKGKSCATNIFLNALMHCIHVVHKGTTKCNCTTQKNFLSMPHKCDVTLKIIGVARPGITRHMLISVICNERGQFIHSRPFRENIKVAKTKFLLEALTHCINCVEVLQQKHADRQHVAYIGEQAPHGHRHDQADQVQARGYHSWRPGRVRSEVLRTIRHPIRGGGAYGRCGSTCPSRTSSRAHP